MLHKFLPITILAVLIAGLLAGCSSPTPTIAPTIDVRPTIDAASTAAVQTVIVQMTASAPTATEVPTNTPVPTETATPEPTATVVLPTATATIFRPTWTFVPTIGATSTNTAVPSVCSITTTEPASGASLTADSDFDAKWVVKNTGSAAWKASETDIRYVSGSKMQVGGDVFDLGADVAAGASATIIIDMKAPNMAGKYAASWVLANGSTVLCQMSVSITVP